MVFNITVFCGNGVYKSDIQEAYFDLRKWFSHNKLNHLSVDKNYNKKQIIIKDSRERNKQNQEKDLEYITKVLKKHSIKYCISP